MGRISASIQQHPVFILLCVILCLAKLSFCIGDPDVTCIDSERKALVEFKHGLTDLSGRLSSWDGEDCCKWGGVTCNNRTGHVVELNLRNNAYSDSLDGDGTVQSLSGKIDPSLLALQDLNYLDLSMNDFGGAQIPSFIGSLQSLRYLNLSGANFSATIPSSLGNLSRLSYLDLNNRMVNSDQTSLHWLSGLSSLKYLDLGGWDLTMSAAYWLQTINRLPSLLELHLPYCHLSNLPLTLPFVNFTSLAVLDLSNNGFNSILPHWLFNLKSLVHLDLSTNNLHGAVPDEIAKLASLKKLDLSLNNIGGQLSRHLGKLCNLQSLKLSANNITGEITDAVDSLSSCSKRSLITLDLGYNELTGNLPDSLGHLQSLRYLRLSNNLFEGSIPHSIGNLTSLEQISLSNNEMSVIPENLGKLSTLTVLDISENKWEGVITEAHLMNLSSLKEVSMDKLSPNISLVFNISSDWIPPFKLTYLYIRSCQLGPKFPTWLKNQAELTMVVLNNARISGTIPNWFLNLDLQLDKLDLAYNQLSGRVPNTFRFNDPCTVDLSSNKYEGRLPLWSSNVSMLYLRDNKFSGPIPPDIGEVMPWLSDLDIAKNSLSGSIPLSIGKLTGLTTLVMYNNELSGKIPDFWENMPSLYIVDMSNNSLSGTIPISMGFLSFLEFLVLSSNNLSGELPSSLKNCSHIVSMDLGDNKLTGKLPAWIGESMPTMFILRLRSNSLTGNIAAQFCELSNLHIMDLSHNSLSGQIPHCIGNLSGLKSELTHRDTERYEGQLEVVAKGRVLQYASTLYLVNSLDLSDNMISGDIPVELTDLINLGTLNLSMNHLTGKIPENIGNYERLETLDLSINKLSGTIPTSMSSLTFLNHLNLSHNNLSGKIPTDNQFQTLDDPSIYQGNVGLCGTPLLTDCAEGGKKTPRGDDEEDEDEDGGAFEKLGCIISTVIGFFVGFWGVCGPLAIKDSWRTAYFDFADKVKKTCSSTFRRMFVPEKHPWMT